MPNACANSEDINAFWDVQVAPAPRQGADGFGIGSSAGPDGNSQVCVEACSHPHDEAVVLRRSCL